MPPDMAAVCSPAEVKHPPGTPAWWNCRFRDARSSEETIKPKGTDGLEGLENTCITLFSAQ